MCAEHAADEKSATVMQSVILSDVTVFLRGAELSGYVELDLPAGESEVILSNVSKQVIDNTLLVAANNGVLILSAGVRYDYIHNKEFSHQARKIKEDLRTARISRDQLQIQINVINEELAVMKANRQLAQEGQKISVTELAQMMDFVAQRTTQALNKQAQLGLEIKAYDEQIQRLEQQLEIESASDETPVARIALKLFTPQAAVAQIDISYVVLDAGWEPSYDLHVQKINEPVHMTYKARVFQNTGVDWENVRLTLSSGRPAQGAQRPVLYPWYVDVERPLARGAAVGAGHMAAPMATEMAEEAVPVMAKETRTRVQYSTTLADHVSTDTQGIHIKFEIAIPYTIPSDGKGQIILVQDADVPASYQYVAVPKLDADAFLQANIASWQNLNLLPGVTNVYFENAFVGQGRMGLDQIRDGMEVSLGRDERIIVERIQDKNNTGAAGLFGSSMQRMFAYTLKVKNTRADAVKLVVIDQLPVSRNDEITLCDLHLEGAQHEENTGELKWTMSLQAGQAQTIAYSYALKYPKEARVSGL